MRFQGTGSNSMGGFTWSLHFTWVPIPDRVRAQQKTRVDPYMYLSDMTMLRLSGF